jgi:hypothetical protein
MFYQKMWEVIKKELVEMFEEFHRGRLDLYRLNFALVIVIPKEKDVRTMNKFRPISFVNCKYTIFTKVLTHRIGRVIDRLVASNQTTFKGEVYLRDSCDNQGRAM